MSVCLVAMLAACAAAPAHAQSAYPDRPIRILVPFVPGGAADLVARIYGQPLSERLGQPVVIENRPGANGNIAAEAVAHSPADGYTLLLGPSALFAINPHLYAKMPLDPLKEFVPVASLMVNALVLAVNPKLAEGMDFKAFVSFAKSKSPPLFFGSIGLGSEHQLAMELLKQRAGFEMTHVPYRGGGPAAVAAISGDIAGMFGGGSVFPMIQQGQLKGLAVTSAQRLPQLPDLPTIAEVYPGYEVGLWLGLFAPAGTPPAIVSKLYKEIAAVRATADLKDHLAKSGAGEPMILTQEKFTAHIKADNETFGAIIKSIGARVE